MITATEATFCAVHKNFGITKAKILGVRRNSDIVHARFAVAKILRDVIGMSLPEVGRKIKRDHTTVWHAVNRADQMLASDCDFHTAYTASVTQVFDAIGTVPVFKTTRGKATA